MRYRWEIALVGVCAIWGWTFVVVQDAIALVPPFRFLALRFAIASAALAVAGAFRGTDRTDLGRGSLMGAALFAGYALQTVGLQHTSASNAGFITGLFVVFTPLLGALVLRSLPSRGASIGVVLATGGLVLLAMPERFALGRGDALVLACAIAFAAHILILGRLGPGRSALRLAGIQVLTVAATSTAWAAAGERGAVASPGAEVWVAIAITGVLASAVAFLIQTRAQQEIPPTRTAVILTAEPVFAGIFGYWLAGDRLGARGIAGAALIVAGILAAELLAPRKERV